MKISVLTIIIFLFSFAIYSQSNVKKSPIQIEASISNLKLGLDEEYIINKYGDSKLDSLINSTRITYYESVKLDNNHEIENVFFKFYKKKLFQISFKYNSNVHNGLVAKYGFKEIDEYTGYYGDFKNDIDFSKAGDGNNVIIFLKNDTISSESEKEGF